MLPSINHTSGRTNPLTLRPSFPRKIKRDNRECNPFNERARESVDASESSYAVVRLKSGARGGLSFLIAHPPVSATHYRCLSLRDSHDYHLRRAEIRSLVVIDQNRRIRRVFEVSAIGHLIKGKRALRLRYVLRTLMG